MKLEVNSARLQKISTDLLVIILDNELKLSAVEDLELVFRRKGYQEGVLQPVDRWNQTHPCVPHGVECFVQRLGTDQTLRVSCYFLGQRFEFETSNVSAERRGRTHLLWEGR